MKMTSRERVMTALEHRAPDRPPLNYFGTPETDALLMRHLRLETREELLRYFGADVRYVAPRYVGPSEFVGMTGFGVGGKDIWGLEWKPAGNEFCTYYEVANHPLAAARTLKELESYPWPSLDWFSVSRLKEDIASLNADEPMAIVLPLSLFFETAWALRGFENYLMDMIDRPEMSDFLLGKTALFLKQLGLRAIEAAGDQIDIVWSASDVGMQTGMIFSPDLWRSRVKPWHRELIEPFKRMGFKTRYHTDGSVAPIIEDLVEMGLDLLDPIQPNTPGMDAENLRKLFGGRLSFYGGVDAQNLLPHGKADQVEREVLRLIRVLGEKGGYVVAGCNAIQPDVPIENILTLFRTAREYRYD